MMILWKMGQSQGSRAKIEPCIILKIFLVFLDLSLNILVKIILVKKNECNVCLIFCYFLQMLQFDFTCVQPASSARMSIQNGATTDPYIAWRSALIENPGTRYGKVDAQFNVL